MKYLIAIGLLALGLVAGFFWGKSTIEKPVLTDNSPQEIDTQVIRDTIVETQFVEIPAEENLNDTSLNKLDTSNVLSDSLLTEVLFVDTNLVDDDININREKLLQTIKIPISYLITEVDNDTTIKDLMGIEDSHPRYIFVEFWQSPLNFEGYKLSKSKLVIYGLSTQFDYQFYRKSNKSYLAYQDIYYLMEETQEFLPYLQVEKGEVFND